MQYVILIKVNLKSIVLYTQFYDLEATKSWWADIIASFNDRPVVARSRPSKCQTFYTGLISGEKEITPLSV